MRDGFELYFLRWPWLRDAQQNLAAVGLTAQQLQTALPNAQGDTGLLLASFSRPHWYNGLRIW